MYQGLVYSLWELDLDFGLFAWLTNLSSEVGPSRLIPTRATHPCPFVSDSSATHTQDFFAQGMCNLDHTASLHKYIFYNSNYIDFLGVLQ